jgi:hypothetical protein
VCYSIFKKTKEKRKRKKKNAAPKIVLYHTLKKETVPFNFTPTPYPNFKSHHLINCLGHGHFPDEILYFVPIASGYQKIHAFLY